MSRPLTFNSRTLSAGVICWIWYAA